MDPRGDTDRNSLKRRRAGSLDAEHDRPPPRQRGVDPLSEANHSHSMMVPHPRSGGQLHSNASQSFGNLRDSDASWLPPSSLYPPLSNNNIPSYERLMRTAPTTLVPPQIPVSDFPIFSTQTNQTYISGGTNIESHGTLHFHQRAPPATPDPYVLQLQTYASDNAIHTSAAVDDQDMCVPGTRAFTLQHLQSLVASVDSNDPDLIWMHGPAGAGKSAIMRTMANALDDQGVLLGSFFFFRSDSQRNTSAPFIPTLSLQSFTSIQTTQPHIRNAIQSHPTIFSQSIRHQLRHLFETPLKLATADEPKWTAQSPLVLVIDGLDECADAKRQVEIIKAMRQLASTIRSSTNRRVKILIASRPEKPIKDEFERDESSTTIIELTPSDANIDLFYDTRFDEIRRDKNLPESWPPLRQIKWLKEKTSCQYSFAHISMGFLAGGDPVERLNMLETGVVTHGLEPFEALDALYATIFRQIPPEMADNALLVVRFWLKNPDLVYDDYDIVVGRVFSFPLGFPSRLLPHLSSIFYLQHRQYRPYHASLGDFLDDPLRSRKYSLFLDVQTLSTVVVNGLLHLCAQVPPPIDEETNKAWFEFYRRMISFVNYCTCLRHYVPLLNPTMATKLGQLPLSLPTMDLYAFGYCNYVLSMLYKCPGHQEHPLASHLSPRHTIGRLLDQIHSIQRLRFSTYEVIEAEGNSGLGLFGLLLLFVSCREDCVWLERSRIRQPCRVEGIVGHLIRVHEGIPNTEHNVEEPLSLRTLVHQLCTIKELAHKWLPRKSYILFWSISLWGLLSTSINHNPQKLRRCLSQAIEMFLDLPSQRSQIQRHISEFISCPDHATLRPDCDLCTANLEQSQTSVIHAVIQFLSSDYDRIFGSQYWMIDARLFIRCYNALKGARDHSDENEVYWYMVRIGEDILRRLKQEEPGGVDTPTIVELRTIIASLHEMRDHHGFSDDSDEIPRDSCWVCNKNGQPPDDSETDSDGGTRWRIAPDTPIGRDFSI